MRIFPGKTAYNPKRAWSGIFSLIIPILLYLILKQKKHLIVLGSRLPACQFHALSGLYCPACGNTRSITALLHGRLMASLHYNITPFLFLLLFLGAYLELVTYSLGKHRKILPKKSSFYVVITGLWVLYLVLRNFIPCLMP
jgi:hypothetical protein